MVALGGKFVVTEIGFEGKAKLFPEPVPIHCEDCHGLAERTRCCVSCCLHSTLGLCLSPRANDFRHLALVWKLCIVRNAAHLQSLPCCPKRRREETTRAEFVYVQMEGNKPRRSCLGLRVNLIAVQDCHGLMVNAKSSQSANVIGVRRCRANQPRQWPQQWATTDAAGRVPRKAPGTGRGKAHLVHVLEASAAQFAASAWRTHNNEKNTDKSDRARKSNHGQTPKKETVADTSESTSKDNVCRSCANPRTEGQNTRLMTANTLSLKGSIDTVSNFLTTNVVNGYTARLAQTLGERKIDTQTFFVCEHGRSTKGKHAVLSNEAGPCVVHGPPLTQDTRTLLSATEHSYDNESRVLPC